jgi:serine/threonine protein kinase
MASGQKTMITDMYGESLEGVFDRGGRYFDMQLVLEIANQLVFRLEWMHSRHVSHGHLSPSSFAIGGSPWQTPQVVLADFGKADTSQCNAYQDLHAIGEILLYLSTCSASWAEFQIHKNLMTEIPSVLKDYFVAISAREFNPADYIILRRHFYTARRNLSKRMLIGGLNSPPKHGSSLKFLASKSTGDLFEILGSKLSTIGQAAKDTNTKWIREQGELLLGSLSEIMTIYFVLLMRDNPSRKRRRYLMGAYHLPNRLWRDLRWYLCMAKYGPLSLQRIITLTIYKYMGTLLECIPLYNRYWMGFLSELAHAQMDLDEDCFQSWRQVWIYWKDCANFLARKCKAER